ncbi:thioesterase domain-containing protein [Solwaraspora sp. WMMD937]|uniref:thioesterase II family protein n=1 Tax=Solwaraspora sp. WMMD937 TaxID=3016090 RepID=UPI00249B4C9B|nr:thioesterase domain-containing protein [Solwaraspora sp. WMMD937]WFE20527.1 thioesterase domain-containing protein [Solwaraspora sp. WMMD937]
MPAAVEELLRILSVADSIPLRVAAADINLDGTRIQAGDGIIALLAAADHDGEVHRRDDDGLCAELNRLGGTHDEVLADPELRRAVLGYVRNDYRLIETYRPAPAAPLDCPVMVLRGDADPELDDGQAYSWGQLTSGRFDVRTFPGDHFYLVPQRRAVISAILSKLDPVLTRTPVAWPSMP